jgi:hypothetical protein
MRLMRRSVKMWGMLQNKRASSKGKKSRRDPAAGFSLYDLII